MNLALLATAAGIMTQAFGGAPQFGAKLYADADAIQPGGSAEIAIAVTVADPWHIYHRNPLSTGFPTTFDFELPDGFSVSEIRFPAPKLSKMAGIEYLGYGGTTTFLATLSADKSVETGGEVTLKVKVNALACLESCIPVDTKTSMTLAVKAQSGAAANAKIFDKARKKLPPPLATAPQIKSAKLMLSQDKVRVGDELLLTLVVELEDGWHMQDRDPGVPNLIPARLFIEPIAGFEIDEERQKWSEPVVVDMPGIGKVRQHDKRVVISTPIKLTDSKVEPGERKAWILFQYQACNDEGVCAFPQLAEMSLPIEIVAKGTAVKTIDAAAVTSSIASGASESVAAGDPAVASVDVTGEDHSLNEAAAVREQTPLWMALSLGLLGGLILNIMPCVLPVISIKVLSFVQQGGENPKRVFRMGLSFCAGIMVWFWLFAALSSTGNLPLQYPAVVIGIGSVLFVMALNLFGVFEIALPGAAAGTMSEMASHEGYAGSFFKGLLATLLGTACTAPFLATALIYATTQPWYVVFLVFSAAGVGMAAPYLLLAWKPAWLKFIPKPGPWMVTFKQGAGFVLIGTAIWLLWVLAGQLGASGVVWTTGFWAFLAVSAWIIGKSKPTWQASSRAMAWTSAIAFAVFGGWFSYGYMYEPEEHQLASTSAAQTVQRVAEQGWEEEIPWAPYRKGLAEELSNLGYTVYVDYTARWCGTCQANKAVVLETDGVRPVMEELGVIPLEADFTNRDEAMLKEINSFDRPSVPLNLIYPAGHPEKVIKLPVTLTTKRVVEALRKAGKSTVNVAGNRGQTAATFAAGAP